jgi:hypothetical protein
MARRVSAEPMSGQRHRPVVVAMIAMQVVEPSVHQVIDMITMRDGIVRRFGLAASLAVK